MKSSLFYFTVVMKDDQKDIILAAKNGIIARRWVRNFKIAVKYQEFILFIKPISAADQVVEILDDEKGEVVLHKRKV